MITTRFYQKVSRKKKKKGKSAKIRQNPPKSAKSRQNPPRKSKSELCFEDCVIFLASTFNPGYISSRKITKEATIFGNTEMKKEEIVNIGGFENVMGGNPYCQKQEWRILAASVIFGGV
jgi:hypothetical protein